MGSLSCDCTDFAKFFNHIVVKECPDDISVLYPSVIRLSLVLIIIILRVY